jgi:hypothetical protein
VKNDVAGSTLNVVENVAVGVVSTPTLKFVDEKLATGNDVMTL